MSVSGSRVIWGGLFAGILALACVGVWKSRGSDPMLIQDGPRQLAGVMGTQTEVTVVARADEEDLMDRAQELVEQVLRTVESCLSVHIEQSELSALNSASAGQLVPMSPRTVQLLKRSRELTELTGGAFDPTAKPLFELWVRAGEEGKAPTDEEIRQALEASGWDDFELFPGESDGVLKRRGTAAIDLGGVAKGYAVDRAVEAMRSLGCTGGMVNVGGDLRFFGKRPGGDEWVIGIQDPFDTESPEPLLRIRLTSAAVCTSGNYRRYSQIDGKRYSHVIDPRTGRPAEAAPSVTVVAPDAATADAWATALSVMGPAGLAMMEHDESVKALVITGDKNEHTMHMSGGFEELIVDPQPVLRREAPIAGL